MRKHDPLVILEDQWMILQKSILIIAKFKI